MSDGPWRIEPAKGPFSGEYRPPGDRGITHRALILGALALGPTGLSGALESADTVATRRVLAHLGVTFTTDEEGWLVVTRQARRFNAPAVELDCGRSATAMRLLCGVLVGQPFPATLTGADDLLSRPMHHVVEPLKAMGARVECLGPEGRPPLEIHGGPLTALDYDLPAARAEAGSALMLAALLAAGTSRIGGLGQGRDHTERLLRHMGISLRRRDGVLTLRGGQHVQPRRLKIPGDMSAAAPFAVAATLVEGSEIVLNQVGANPGRMGLLKTLGRIGGDVARERDWQYGAEPVSSFRVRHAPRLEAFNVAPNLAPSLLDEFPLLALVATRARGSSHLRSGSWLRRTPPDRLLLTAQILRQFGADVELEEDGLTVHGPRALTGAEVQCAGDRRLALLAATAALLADGPSVLHGVEAVGATYPGLIDDFSEIATGARGSIWV